MSPVIPILLFILGLVFISAEVFFPSMGILTLLATGSVAASVILAFVHLGTMTGVIFLLGVLVLVPVTLVIAFRALPKTPFGKKLILDGPTFQDTKGAAVTQDIDGLVGLDGIAVTPLRPAGIAEIDGRRVDVVTRGNMIEKGETIRVVLVEGNRVIVDRAGGPGNKRGERNGNQGKGLLDE